MLKKEKNKERPADETLAPSRLISNDGTTVYQMPDGTFEMYSVALVPIGAAPWLLGYAGAVYGVTALLAGALMVAFAWRVRCEHEGARAARAAQHMFAFSILYLFLVFAVLLAEGGLAGFIGRVG